MLCKGKSSLSRISLQEQFFPPQMMVFTLDLDLREYCFHRRWVFTFNLNYQKTAYTRETISFPSNSFPVLVSLLRFAMHLLNTSNDKSKFCCQPHLADNSTGRQTRKKPVDSVFGIHRNILKLMNLT